jgi:acetylglutamate kinase
MKQKLKVVKIGGNVIDDKDSLASFLTDFALMSGYKILVHGGGKKATQMASALGLQPVFVGGRRITDEANLEIAAMVYAGLLNKTIVAGLQSRDCNAIGLSGADGNVIEAHKRIVKDVDYGFAGDVDRVNTQMVSLLLQNEMCPVFCAITHNGQGQLLNTNADTIAAEVAKGLAADYEVELIYCFEKNGVLLTLEDDNSVIEKIDPVLYSNLKEKGIIAAGMLPKLENCFLALNTGVSKVVIGNPSVIKANQQKFTTLSL